MELNEYQEKALQTANYPNDSRIIYPVLGLNGEAGEVAEKVKKVIRDNEGIFDFYEREKIAKELGDVLWYLAMAAYDVGYSLESIAKINVAKLKERKEKNMLHGSGDDREV